MSWISFKGFVATSQPVEAYGGVQLAEEVLHDLVEQWSEVSIKGHHDGLRDVRTRDVAVELKPTADGYLGVWVEGLAWEADWIRLGGINGFSVSGVEPLPEEVWPSNDDQQISVSADAAHFSDDDLAEALAIVSQDFKVGGGRLYQFSEIPPARIIIELAMPLLMQLGPNLVASALWDGLKFLVARYVSRVGRAQAKAAPPSMEFVVRGGEFSAQLVIRSADEDLIQKGLDNFPRAIAAARDAAISAGTPPSRPVAIGFDCESQEWKVPDQ